jgi:prepilin-type N-terminal cleavage/methylation domain-containing protein
MQTGRESGSRNPRRGKSHGCEASRLSFATPGRSPVQAFTLLEIMMVVAIIGLILTIGVPGILRTMHEEPLRKAVNDVINICSHARAQAVLHGETTTIVFHPESREMALAVLATTNAPAGLVAPEAPAGETKAASYSASALNSTQFGDGITIDMLDVNLLEYKDADEARVRFFPNGTSDEMTLIIHAGDQYRKITLEVPTGLASTEVIR